MSEADPYDLGRFVAAQDAGGTFPRALAELRAGRKCGHWMSMSRRYAIRSLSEARAYLAHPVLGTRLAECARTLTRVSGSDVGPRAAERIFGDIDATKLRSSMTLFARADPSEPVFGRVLDLYFNGQADPLTDRAVAGADDTDFTSLLP